MAYGRINPKYSIPKQKENISLLLMVRHGKWKCFTDFEGNAVELYNLETDPNENGNQAEQFPELAEELKAKLLNWFKENDKSELHNN
ncbi:MAG: hypothetical protein MI922_23670 [Bacteroidales bacterium]|nr:hypothetical protein [Bacteroidales bacterium]